MRKLSIRTTAVIAMAATICLTSCLNTAVADIQFNRQADWAASQNQLADPNYAHGTDWDPAGASWSYYTDFVAPGDSTVVPGTAYAPADLTELRFWSDKGSFYGPYGTPNAHIPFEYETMGQAGNLYVYWNAVQYQTGGTQIPFDPAAPYGKQQWCVAVFTNQFSIPITVSLSGDSEIQTAGAGALDGTKMEIATIDSSFTNKTVLWSHEFPSGSAQISGDWNTFTTAYMVTDMMLVSAVQNVTLNPGESIAFGLRAGYLEQGVGGVTAQYLRTQWDDSAITITATASAGLTVDASPAIAASGVSGAGSYTIGDEITVSAVDVNDCGNGIVYKFDHWTGDVAEPTSAETTVVMDGNKTVTAVYAATAQCGDACHPVPDADFANGDCTVNLLDLLVLVDQWLSSSL